MIELWPASVKLEHTIRDASIACPLPSFAIRKIEVIVQKVCLESLQGATHDLPSVSHFLQGTKRYMPAGPEKVLRAFVKGVIDFPQRMKMLLDDGVTRVCMLRMHIEDHINGSRPLQLETASRHHTDVLPPLRGESARLCPPRHHWVDGAFVDAVTNVAVQFQSL